MLTTTLQTPLEAAMLQVWHQSGLSIAEILGDETTFARYAKHVRILLDDEQRAHPEVIREKLPSLPVLVGAEVLDQSLV